MTTKKLILIIDDEVSILQTLKAALEDEDYAVQTLNDGKKALDIIGKITPDLILLDISMPGCNGIEILATIKHNYPEQKVIMISGFGTIPVAIDALKNGASDFIEKPLNLDDLLKRIAFLTTQNSQATPHIHAATDFNAVGIAGSSVLFCELMHHIKLIAPLQTPLIIYGPKGSGRTRIAHYVHAKSTRALHMVTEFDCAAHESIPESMLQAQGSLILKNIATINSKNQRLLLNHIETNTSTRIIATSTPSLFSLVQKGLFDASLFCKLNATPCEIPPLNKRRYDIPLLINYFLIQANALHNKTVFLTNDAIRILCTYNWTGDVAELKNTLTTIVLTAPTPGIDAFEIQKYLPGHRHVFINEQHTQIVTLQTTPSI